MSRRSNFTIVLHIKEKMHTFNSHNIVQLRILKKTRKFCHWMRYIWTILWSSLLIYAGVIHNTGEGEVIHWPCSQATDWSMELEFQNLALTLKYKVFFQNLVLTLNIRCSSKTGPGAQDAS